jgi:MFS family permease
MGTVSDVVGRKPVMLMGMLTLAAETVVLAFVPTLALVFVCRMISGIGDCTLSIAYAVLTGQP